MNSKVIVNCTDMQHCYRWPYEPWVSACNIHMKECTTCCEKYSPYFNAIDDDLSHGITSLSKAINSFYLIAKQCGQNGRPGAGGALAIKAAKLVMTDLEIYMTKDPNNNIIALIWLQRVFTVCRFFESQARCESNIPSKEKSLRVSEMVEPNGEGSYGEITTLSYLMKHNDKYSTFTFNFELYQITIELLKSGEYYRAIRLICDSPKHGVLSSILNFAAIVWAKQIYSIGLHALSEVIYKFIKEFREESGLSES
jgi:hypothetical protein